MTSSIRGDELLVEVGANNGRAAILNDTSGFAPFIYTAGNAGNGAAPEPESIVTGAGAQIMNESFSPESAQSPGAPTPVASFSPTELGDPADKIGKDDNFRGLTVSDNVVYYTKGSGGNGINTVYFVDTTGNACPDGVGVPEPGAALPTTPLSFDPSTVASTGLPSNMCILRGFPTTLAKSASANAHPFGIWFANPDTIYVADEGNGDATYSAATNTYTAAATSTTAGLQKWVYDQAIETWTLAYTLQTGLSLGQPCTVADYPTGNNAATGEPWAPADDGLRNLTGRVNRNGTVTLYAVTSTVSGSGDSGADPNALVSITDRPSASAPAPLEQFSTVISGKVGGGVNKLA